MIDKNITRRDFVKASTLLGSAGLFPTLIPSAVLGQNAPSNRIAFAMIGVGGMGMGNVKRVTSLRSKGTHIVGVCDVDRVRREGNAKKVDEMQASRGCVAVNDFRELTRRDDIDAVVVSTPDHWHAIPAIDAMRHGKDVYVEKPLTTTIHEGQVLVAEMKKYQRVGQTGTQQRSSERFRYAAELVRNGYLGQIERIEVLIPANNKYCGATWQAEPVPEGFDYDMWLGPAPWAPFARERCHYSFRFGLDYSGGQVTNWGAHYIDIAQWAMGKDESGPVKMIGQGEYPTTGLFNTATRVDFTATYDNGVPLRVRTRYDGVFDGNVRFYGSQGWLDVSRRKLTASDPKILETKIGGGDIRLYVSTNHMGNLVDCIRSRKAPVSDLSIGHRTTTICNLGNIAMTLKRPLVWDPVKEEFPDDPMANRMKDRPMRGPWSLC